MDIGVDAGRNIPDLGIERALIASRILVARPRFAQLAL
jgi:hypothetical protein